MLQMFSNNGFTKEEYTKKYFCERSLIRHMIHPVNAPLVVSVVWICVGVVFFTIPLKDKCSCCEYLWAHALVLERYFTACKMLLESKERYKNQFFGIFSTNFLFQVWDFSVSLRVLIT